ncbi:MAG: DUF4097 family beta strand repeat-containing protein [Spirochaetota bacterium]
MNDERAMILKMLQEGKISVDEANALLDVLNEPQPGEPGGFAKAEADPTRGAGTAGVHGDFDFAGLKDTLRATMGSVRETMRGVSDSLRDAFEGFGGFDFVHEFGRAMGRAHADEERRLFAETGPDGTLRITNSWGDVRVTGTDSAAVAGTARVTCWAADEERAREKLAGVSVTLDRRDGEWVVESEPADRHSTRIDFELQVPRALAVVVTTASGDLWLEDLSGSQTVNTMSGDINVASLGSDCGAVQLVSSKSGDIIGAALTGDVTLNTLSGDVSVNGFSGVLRVSTQSGDIGVRDGHGSVQLKTMSGDVRAALLSIGAEDVALSSVSGDVDLTVPTDAAFDLEARSTSGDVRAESELEDAVRSGRRLQGRRNGGGVSVTVTSVSGDIIVRD